MPGQKSWIISNILKKVIIIYRKPIFFVGIFVKNSQIFCSLLTAPRYCSQDSVAAREHHKMQMRVKMGGNQSFGGPSERGDVP